MATFVRNFGTKNFQKLPNLVTLNETEREREREREGDQNLFSIFIVERFPLQIPPLERESDSITYERVAEGPIP